MVNEKIIGGGGGGRKEGGVGGGGGGGERLTVNSKWKWTSCCWPVRCLGVGANELAAAPHCFMPRLR